MAAHDTTEVLLESLDKAFDALEGKAGTTITGSK